MQNYAFNMVMKYCLFNTFVILLLLLPYHASADEGLTPIKFKGIYELSFAGLPFGKMGAELEEKPDYYSVTTDVTFTGLLKLIVQHMSHSNAQGAGRNFLYPDIVYETHYQTKKKKHYIKLTYTGGVLSKEEQVPPDPPGKRPEVPMDMKKDAADPVSIILKARKLLWEARKKGVNNFSSKLYDGNRLMQVDFTIVGDANINYGNKSVPVIKVSARRTLLSGYTKSELSDYNPNEPPCYFFFTDDERLLPIKAQTMFLMSQVSAMLVKECLPDESCLLGLKE
jgi:hypothetical protein